MSEDDKPRGERAVKAKAKLPDAKNIRSPEFTPHGISGGSRTRGPRPSGKTAAQAKKQRRIAIALSVIAVLAIAGGTTYVVTRPGPAVAATGALGKAPKVSIPKDLLPPSRLKVTSAIKGTGPKITKDSTVLAKFAFYQWAKSTDTNKPNESTNKKINSSWEQPAAQQVTPMTVGKTGLKGLDKGLLGQTAGSRLILEIPPSEGFGQQAQQLGLSANDSMVFVVDVLGAYPKGAEVKGTPKSLGKDLPTVGAMEAGKGPKVTIPKSDPPKDLVAETLIEGTGPATTKNDTVVVNYRGVLWRTGKDFDSSWTTGQIATFPLNTTEGATGFFRGLQGKKIGSRVLLVVPPKDGYGKKGNAQAGIKGDDTMVFSVDLLGTVPK